MCSWHQIHFDNDRHVVDSHKKKKRNFFFFFVNDNEVIKKVFDRENGSEFFNGMQAYLFARHIPMKWGFIGVLIGGHLSARLQRKIILFFEWNLCFMIFMLAHSLIIFFAFSWLFFFALWSPMWNFIISTWCSPSGLNFFISRKV